jgi:HEPN domain-containing protein
VPSRSAELAAAWRAKAGHDLENARLLIVEQRRLLDIAAYHCQQAGEKSLKAYLTAKEQIFPKTHILEKLLDLCLPLEGAFESLRAGCEKLTPLADEFRCPGDAFDPTAEEAANALRMAEEIYAFCRQQLSDS